MSKTIRVLLANGFPLIRAGIRAVVAAENDLTLVGEAIDGYEVQRLCQELQPDVLLLDLDIPGPAPFETVIVLHKQCPAVRVLLLTAYNDIHLPGLIAAGAVGCILKDESTEALIRAIRTVFQGDTWFSHRLIIKLTQSNIYKLNPPKAADFTDRELEVLQLVVQGYSNNRIASDLVISERTVRFHLRNLYDKLKVNTRGELLSWALRAGFDKGKPEVIISAPVPQAEGFRRNFAPDVPTRGAATDDELDLPETMGEREANSFVD